MTVRCLPENAVSEPTPEVAEVSEAQTQRPETSTRIPELDGLRGLAILLVVICHYIGYAEHAQLGYWPHHFLTALIAGWSGVDLFFVLSGFLIGGILLDSRNSRRYFQTFYLRRAHRILPIYYAWIVIYAAIIAGGLYLVPGRLPVAGRDVGVVPIYVLFLQNMIYGPSVFQWIWFAVTWSLAVEEQFYLFAPPLIRFVSLRRLVYVLTTVVCVAPVLRYLLFRYLTHLYYLPQILMPCRADTLALGILAAVAWRQQAFRSFLDRHPEVLQRCVAYLLVVLAPMTWWFTDPTGLMTYTIGYGLLAALYACLLLLVISQAGGVVARLVRVTWLRYLGGISYGVYLIHLTINQWAHRLLLNARPRIYDLKGVGVTLLAGAMTLVVASLSWKYFERPLIRRGHRYLY
jgi:peptidoglycan/LPS O-acetylase OafA/YrhL